MAKRRERESSLIVHWLKHTPKLILFGFAAGLVSLIIAGFATNWLAVFGTFIVLTIVFVLIGHMRKGYKTGEIIAEFMAAILGTAIFVLAFSMLTLGQTSWIGVALASFFALLGAMLLSVAIVRHGLGML